jgi:hypothetical protein
MNHQFSFHFLFFSKNKKNREKNGMQGIAHASSTWLCTWYSLGHDDQLDVSYRSLKQIWGPLIETCREMRSSLVQLINFHADFTSYIRSFLSLSSRLMCVK